MWGQVQTVSKGCENNKVPTIVRMEPMDNATQVSKKEEPETLQNIREEGAQELGLTRHQLLLKTGHQLKDLSERKLQRAFDKVNLVALIAQRKVEEDSAMVQKLAAQMVKYPNFDKSSTCPTSRTKMSQKQPHPTNPRYLNSQGSKTKVNLFGDSDNFSNVPNKRHRRRPDIGKWINLHYVIKNWKLKRTNGNNRDTPTGISDNRAYLEE